MTVNNVTLEAVAVAKDGFPKTGLPEIALCGRSNVGKSSLINYMVNRKSLARTSQSPGKTRTINFYNIENELYFVDLPGYGYSKASKAESAKWGKMVEGYLKNRPELKAVILLLDIRREPSADDRMMLEFIRHYNLSLIIAATKADKITRSKIPAQIKAIIESLGLGNETPVVPFSVLNKQGREELWGAVGRAARANEK
ncbi:MAG: ribosome biogenesis GTP-binding protein YihA/YsxC [Clostridiales bacterium]|jgi:GTP-binding protein|nr:ribosome biogenesis GTP-binding protein YihA/YsxC [Clostridiales bacterium]